MEDIANQIAKELAMAIGNAVANDPECDKIHEKARAQGLVLRVSLEAVIQFVEKKTFGPDPGTALVRRDPVAAAAHTTHKQKKYQTSANDRRFLRSLRISPQEENEKEVE